MSLDTEAVISALGLQPHPEGGWFAETWRGQTGDGQRGTGTAIYFLLHAGERSHWHRVDADETWHHYDGGPLELSMSNAGGGNVQTVILGTDLAVGQRPQAVVPAATWQAARPLGDAVLVGCTVSPAFEFSGFELAPPGWEPPGAGPR